MLKIRYAQNTYGPKCVKILTGQSFCSWTHGHGPMALGAWAAAARPPGRRAAAAAHAHVSRSQSFGP